MSGDAIGKAGMNGRGSEPSDVTGVYGLSGNELALVEELCADMLDALGIDGRGFAARLRDSGRIDLALGLTPEIVEALYARAHRWFAVGFPRRAEPLFRALCIAAPKVADHWVGLGICHRIGGNTGAAGTALETALRVRPDWEVPSFHLAELSLLEGRIEDARRHLATFQARAGDATPQSMRSEAQRLDRAVEMRERS